MKRAIKSSLKGEGELEYGLEEGDGHPDAADDFDDGADEHTKAAAPSGS